MLPILKFVPQFKSVLWGGKRIASYKGLPSQGENIGESWELSCVPGHESVVAEGSLKGKNLHEIMLTDAKEILGERLLKRYGTEFPLLIKLIDSADDLSIQVHPDDTLAAKRHHCPGKTEMWVSIAPTDGAYLYSGFNRVISAEEYRNRIADNTIVDTLGKYHPQKGDVFFLPAGRVHSIGKGNFVLEIQQSSDITYRIYDYDRRDAQGNARQLHVEESIDAIDFSDTDGAAPSRIKWIENQEEIIADCNYFTTSAIAVKESACMDLDKRDSFTIIASIDGDAQLVDANNEYISLPQGAVALIPASMPRIQILGNCKIITSYIK